MFHVCSKAEKLYEVRDELLLNKNKPMKFKIRFHLYVHKCVAFKNTSVVIHGVFVFYPFRMKLLHITCTVAQI